MKTLFAKIARNAKWSAVVISIVFLVTATYPVNARSLTDQSGYGGDFTGWPAVWNPMLALNDPDDGLSIEQLDFVGDVYDPGFYMNSDAEYVFFRIRVDDGDLAALQYTISIIIDQVGYGTPNMPDYAIVWDAKSSNDSGLEFQILGTLGTSWANTSMDDIDGNSGQKISPPDFGTSNGDGYARIENGQSTTSYGTTSFIDIAVSWDYLSSYYGDPPEQVSTLAKNQTWHIQLASIDNHDHQSLRYDVAGNVSPDEPFPPEGPSMPATITTGPTAIELVNFGDTVHGDHIFLVVSVALLIVAFSVFVRKLN